VSYDTIGRRYARAIFELAKEEGQPSAAADRLAAFAELYENAQELRDVLDNPLVQLDARSAIVTEIAERMGIGGMVLQALQLITRKRRLRALPAIARHLQRHVDDDAKVVRAHATTAVEPKPGYLDRLRAELEKATGAKVVLTHSVDPSLIGGVVTAIGDRVIDGSLRSRLMSFRDGARPTA